MSDEPDRERSAEGAAPEEALPVREQLFGAQHDRIFGRLEALDPDLAGYIRGFAYDTVYERPGLDLKTKELLACALLLSLGSPDELKTHLRGAMRAGASEGEVRETLLFCAPYLGFPRVVAAFSQLDDLLRRQRARAEQVGKPPRSASPE